MRGAVGKVEAASGNFSSPRYYLVKHVNFYAYYIGDRVIGMYFRSNLDSAIDITEDAAVRVKFTYSVFWNRFKHRSADSIFWHKELCLGHREARTSFPFCHS